MSNAPVDMQGHILRFWENCAKTRGGFFAPTWENVNVVELEIELIDRFLKEGYVVLDVGCCNGYSTIRHALTNVQCIIGVDAIESMIAQARRHLRRVNPPRSVVFEIADARSLPFDDNSFDVVYTTRMLINLPTWDDQRRAMLECVRVCKLGGTTIFSEAFWEPFVRLNAIRSLASLSPLEIHDCNRFLKEREIKEVLAEVGFQYRMIDFCSLYYIGTRFLADLIEGGDLRREFVTQIEKTFYGLEQQFSGGCFGVQRAVVITKTR